ncbi:toll/interleukin-1 receptor domain-containing protein, partial [Nostoc sp. NIES-2111]
MLISYCWQPPENKLWVEKLALNLAELHGIDVDADFYSLEPGSVISSFMERFASDTSIDKVLVICNQAYTERANAKEHGSGAEGHIISANMLDNVSKQDKEKRFIPILRERHPEYGDCIPTFLKGIIFVDFTVSDLYAAKLDELARTVYGKPAKSKPQLGPIPQFALGEPKPNFIVSNTRILIDLIRQSFSRSEDPKPYLDDFRERVIEALVVAVPAKSEVWDPGKAEYNPNPIVAHIESLLPLRDDLVEILTILNKYKKDHIADLF